MPVVRVLSAVTGDLFMAAGQKLWVKKGHHQTLKFHSSVQQPKRNLIATASNLLAMASHLSPCYRFAYKQGLFSGRQTNNYLGGADRTSHLTFGQLPQLVLGRSSDAYDS